MRGSAACGSAQRTPPGDSQRQVNADDAMPFAPCGPDVDRLRGTARPAGLERPIAGSPGHRQRLLRGDATARQLPHHDAEGHVLINTDVESTVPSIRTSVEPLGFQFADNKIILGSHAHGDHMEADALVKELTGAGGHGDAPGR